MDLQTRFELELSAQQWVDSIMSNFNISAADMESALTKVILNLKNRVIQEYFLEQQRVYQESRENNNIDSAANFDSTQEGKEAKEDDSN